MFTNLIIEGPHRSPEKHFLSINKLKPGNDDTSRLVKSRYYTPLGRAWPFIWKKIDSFQLRMFCAKYGWGCLRSFFSLIFTFSLFSTLEKDRGFYFIWTHINSLYPRRLWAQVWSKFTRWFWRKRFKISWKYFLFFAIISPSKWEWQLRFLSVEFDSMAMEKKNIFDVSSLFRYLVPFKKSVALISFKRIEFPLPKDALS